MLFLLIFRKFNTLCFFAIVATRKQSVGAELLPDKKTAFLSPIGA
jgi:hypothetical protein